MKKTIYLTTYDEKTKEPTGASTDLNVKTIEEAEALMGLEPIRRTHNVTYYAGGVCLSWIRFSMAIDILES